jgi:hypothetical protein
VRYPLLFLKVTTQLKQKGHEIHPPTGSSCSHLWLNSSTSAALALRGLRFFDWRIRYTHSVSVCE